MKKISLFIILLVLLTSCWPYSVSLRDTGSMPAEWKSFTVKTLENTANALGSNMFEGFVPTQKGIEIIRDYVIGKISISELITITKKKLYV